MGALVVDISKYNTITISKLKGLVDGVMIRCGYRGYTSGKITADPMFRSFASECVKYNIPFGVYFMSQAINKAEGAEEGEYAVNAANSAGATLPIFIDSEDGDGTARKVRADGLSKTVRTAVVKAFCEQVMSHGKESGVYASDSWFKDNLNYAELVQYLIWVAKYGRNNGKLNADQKPSYVTKYDMWQYTSMGKIAGVTGKIDMNDCYFPIPRSLTEQKPVQNAKFTVGKNYTLQANMFVRDSANGKKKKYTQLTTNAKSHAVKQSDGSAVLKKGTVVTVKAVATKDGATWVKIPSGWLCGISANGKVYIR